MSYRTTFTQVVSLAELEPHRTRHLDDLSKIQDALIEVWVAESAYFVIDVNGERAGYFIVYQGNTLIEYFLAESFELYAHEILPLIAKEKAIDKALIQTFDHVFLAAALDHQTSVKVRGALVRDYVRRELPALAGVDYSKRLATLEDLPRIKNVQQDIFTHPERLAFVIEKKLLLLFERGDLLLGFGIIRPILAGKPDVEVGLAVDKPYRNAGNAMSMLQDMYEYSLRSGYRPVSGAARDNEASVRTGLRIGCIARYRILEVRFA